MFIFKLLWCSGNIAAFQAAALGSIPNNSIFYSNNINIIKYYFVQHVYVSHGVGSP